MHKAFIDEVYQVERDGNEYCIPINNLSKHGFEKRHGEGSYLKLIKLLLQDCKTYVDIGKEFKLTRERIRQIYKRDLALFLPLKSGRERKRSCTIARYKSMPLPPYLKDVWREARKHGIYVERMVSIPEKHHSSLHASTRDLILNGKRVKIFVNTKQFFPTQNSNSILAHSHVSLNTLKNYEVIIFIIDVSGFTKRFFIVPTKDLSACRYSFNKQGIIALYPPIEKCPVYNNIYPKLDWWKYENAWHLLK